MAQWVAWDSSKRGVAVSATCSFQCWVLESWHGNSSSFALHKLHFHCDSRACPAQQPIASLTINLISESAVHLFGSEGIEIIMKWLLSKINSWIVLQHVCVFMLGFPVVMGSPEGPGDDKFWLKKYGSNNTTKDMSLYHN